MSYIRHIETIVPEHQYAQGEVSKVLMDRATSDRARRFIRKAYAESGIETRYSVLDDFKQHEGEERLFTEADGSPRDPSTGARNRVFVDEARRMVPEIARRTVAGCEGIGAEEITHVITVSCTGFFNPGPDLLVVDALGLSSTVQRYHLGFMGCYAALPALKMADQFCRADPKAVVMIICLELCTIHMQRGEELDAIVANSVFADGLSAALVTATPPASGERGYALGRFSSDLAREGADDMAWDIGDYGFNLVLSKYVSRIIGAEIQPMMEGILRGTDRTVEMIRTWAIHPGGRAILDKVESGLGLEAEQVAAVRTVLSRYGNMSSATILFVLDEILRGPDAAAGDSICAMAFGPGLTIETLILDALVP